VSNDVSKAVSFAILSALSVGFSLLIFLGVQFSTGANFDILYFIVGLPIEIAVITLIQVISSALAVILTRSLKTQAVIAGCVSFLPSLALYFMYQDRRGSLASSDQIYAAWWAEIVSPCAAWMCVFLLKVIRDAIRAL
jgi:hypothetical protein